MRWIRIVWLELDWCCSEIRWLVKERCHTIVNLFLGLMGKRLLLADYNIYRIWLDGKRRDDAWRALVPRKAGIEGRGWMDVYLRDVKGDLLILGDHSLASVRKYGLVRWEAL